MIKYIYRHIARAEIRSGLSMGVMLFFAVALGNLHNNIRNTKAEISRLYSESLIAVEVRSEALGGRRFLGDVIPPALVHDLQTLGFINEVYLEGTAMAYIVPAGRPLISGDGPGGSDILVGVENLLYLTEEPEGFLSRSDGFNMEVEFAPGYDNSNFLLFWDVTIPMVLSHELAQQHGLGLGDSVYISYYRPILFRSGEWLRVPARIIGIHNGDGLPNILREAAVIPLAALQSMFGDFTGYYTFKFTIDPSLNQELANIAEELQRQAGWPRYPWRDPLVADIWDQELRFGVASLEQNLLLLELLYPIAVIISVVIGTSLSILTMLQNTKNAAILRVLGTSKHKTRLIIGFGQIIIYAGGALTGILITGSIAVFPVLAGAAVGSVVGVILVTSKAPMELLQVRE